MSDEEKYIPPFEITHTRNCKVKGMKTINVPVLPVDQEFSDNVDEMMHEKTKGTNRRSFKALEEENAELRAEIERLKGGNDFGGHG